MNMPQLPQFCIAMCWYMYYVHAPVATVLYCHVLVDVQYCEHASCHSVVLPCCGCTVNMSVATVPYCHVIALLWTCQLPQCCIAMLWLYCKHASCHSSVLPCDLVDHPRFTQETCVGWCLFCFVFLCKKLKLKRNCTTRNFCTPPF